MRENDLLEKWLLDAENDRPVWIADVREACAVLPDPRRIIARLTALNGSARDYIIPLPRWRTAAQRAFTAEYLRACVFNILSVLGGCRMTFFYDRSDQELEGLMQELPAAFQLHASRRRGVGKVISISDRLCRSLGKSPFAFAFEGEADAAPVPWPALPPATLEPRLHDAAERCGAGLRCGVDIGGTDMKLILARDGELLCVREHNWNPALSPTAEGITEPILDFIRQALDDCAPGRNLDSLGVSFPDVVIRDRIVGGETPKTRGMRHSCADYEAAFARITALRERLLPLCVPGASVRIINDGHMAAFTSAMELAHSGRAGVLVHGIVAHALGTDLGTGWLEPDGSIPESPMELYDLLLDLGSRPSRAWDPGDLRAVVNENSGLPGMRRYVGQAAAFRLAEKTAPSLLDGFTVRRDGLLVIRDDPDMRKPCLAHLMDRAAQGDDAALDIFRLVGAHLGQVLREEQWLLRPSTSLRFLFGRFVQQPACFAAIAEGCALTAPDISLEAADAAMACTPLMLELSRHGGAAVAQFGQAVGAVYYGCMP